MAMGRFGMLTVNLGPLSMPIAVILALVALLVAAGVGLLVGRAQKTGIAYILTDMLLAGVLMARVAFVAIWFDAYRISPWSMLDIRDGGFSPWAGMAAALLVAAGTAGAERQCANRWPSAWWQGRLSGEGCLLQYA